MEYLTCRGLDKPVSRFVFGTPSLLRLSEPDSFALLDEVYHLGINTFDTAAVYAGGALETLLGRWMASRNIADKVVVLTKCSHHNALGDRVNADDIRADCESSLARLGVECLDLLLLHRDDERVPVSVVVDTLNALYQEGKVKVFGASNWTHTRIAEANAYATAQGLQPMQVASPCMSLVRQVESPWKGNCVSIAGDTDAIQYYTNSNTSLFLYSPLGHGMLSGKVKSDNLDPTILDDAAQKAYLYPENIERLRRAEVLAERHGCTVSQIALAWLYQQEFCPALIVGASKIEHVKANLAASELVLTPSERAWVVSSPQSP